MIKLDILFISVTVLSLSHKSHPAAHRYWMVDPTIALPCTESRSSSSGKEQDTSGTGTGSAARPPPGEAGGKIKIAYLSLDLSMH